MGTQVHTFFPPLSNPLVNKSPPGDVAFSAKSSQRTLTMRQPTPLTIIGVYTTLVKIAATSGKGSQDIKETHIKRLLVDAKGEEIRYLVRTLIQHLRIGAVKTTMLIALARAFTLSKGVPQVKEKRLEMFSRAEETVKQCFARRPNYNDMVPALLTGGVEALPVVCGMALHVPLKPMLGSITRDLGEMLVKLQGREFTCEYKYDGQRAQIHCDEEGSVEIFSRHLELMTGKYPDLVALVPRVRGEKVTSFILEGEVVAVDTNTGELKPFQTLAGRERTNIEIGNISVTVCLFVFDLMYMNGQVGDPIGFTHIWPEELIDSIGTHLQVPPRAPRATMHKVHPNPTQIRTSPVPGRRLHRFRRRPLLFRLSFILPLRRDNGQSPRQSRHPHPPRRIRISLKGQSPKTPPGNLRTGQASRVLAQGKKGLHLVLRHPRPDPDRRMARSGAKGEMVVSRAPGYPEPLHWRPRGGV